MESAVTVPLPAAPAIAIVVVRSVMIPVTAPAVSIPAPAIVTVTAVKTPMPVRPVIPRPRADKHAADEPIGTVIAVRRASVRIIAVVRIGIRITVGIGCVIKAVTAVPPIAAISAVAAVPSAVTAAPTGVPAVPTRVPAVPTAVAAVPTAVAALCSYGIGYSEQRYCAARDQKGLVWSILKDLFLGERAGSMSLRVSSALPADED